MSSHSRITMIIASLLLASTVQSAAIGGPLLEDEAGTRQSNTVANATAEMDSPLAFDEVFTHSISPYWCEHNLVTGDYEEDGDVDMLAHVTTGGVGSREARVLLFTNDGSHHFAVTEIDSVREYGYKIVTADFNTDGHLDFAVRAQTTRVYQGDGAGGFVLHQVVHDGTGYGGFDCADLDLDGDVDLVQGYQACCGGRMAALYNDGTGTFTVGWEKTFSGYGTAATIRNLVITHADPDAWPDIAASEIYGGIGYVLRAATGGTGFSQMWIQKFGSRGGSTRLFGVTDIQLKAGSVKDIVFSPGWGRVEIFRPNYGTLTRIWRSQDYGEVSYSLGCGDFDGDGREDLFVGNFGGGRMYIYRNIDGDSLAQAWINVVPGSGYLGSVADIDQDGLSDLIVGEKGMIRVWLNRSARSTQVALDIKPGSCPNPINTKGKPKRGGSVVPAAILGGSDFDVHDIDPSTIRLEGLEPVRWSYEDVSSAAELSGDDCSCSESGPDGFADLTLKFDRNDLVALMLEMLSGSSTDDGSGRPRLGDGTRLSAAGDKPDRQEIRLGVSGTLYDGTQISGHDCVVLIHGDGSAVEPVSALMHQDDSLLIGNFPNPFNPSTEIEYRLDVAAHVRLDVYNIAGRHVATLVDGYRPAGRHLATWEASNYPSGVYFSRLQSAHRSEVRKMILLK